MKKITNLNIYMFLNHWYSVSIIAPEQDNTELKLVFLIGLAVNQAK